ncbi:hypothetical protein SK128_023086 [Halocaridina rubra]|uniref:Uncharacterized protein n=1 Tax=Halocaridina rubra TaxID=373956 RepID=A0AAN9A8W1_HALRR
MALEDDCWRECCEWLARIRLISQDHSLVSQSATFVDLCRFLRDGVMICKILHIIDEDSIDLRAINQRPQNAQFLCMKNIGIFLQTCTRKFDLSKDDLFEPQMLFELSDIGKVLATLSKLSKCPKAQRLHVEGFPAEQISTEDEESPYSNLPKDIMNGPEDVESNYWDEKEAYCFIDEIYAGLRLAPANKQQEPSRSKPREKRDLCLQELVETEGNYVQALEMIASEFYRPLKGLINEEQCRKIFSTIPEMAKTHYIIHQGLRKAQNSSNYTVSQVFLNNQEKLLIYGEYCANLSLAQQELEDLMNNNEPARNQIQRCQDNVKEGKHQLREYLVVPLQRILKYHLLLRELMRCTVQTHSDYNTLKEAYEAMVDLADYINEVKRDSEMLQIIRDLQSSIMDIPHEFSKMEALGKLRHDGDIKIESHPHPIKRRYVFVFDKVMIMCKQTKDEKYAYKDMVKLENCKVDNNVTSTGGLTKSKQNSFYLVLSGNKGAYTIFTKDSDAKEKWMKNISEAIDFLNPPENQTLNHNFAVTTFPRPNTRCEKCRKLLKGTLFQGYQCSKCNMIVHKNCLNEVNRCQGCPPPAIDHIDTVNMSPVEEMPPIPQHRRHSSLPRIPSNSLVHIYPEYLNSLQEYPWWADMMTRKTAEIQLSETQEGTFLLRWSEHHRMPVMSLKANGATKHMKVHYTEEKGWFYLSEARYFVGIAELIQHYSRYSLAESFDGLDCILGRPIFDTAVVRFAYEGTGVSHLSLSLGQRVIILSREGESRGWWKGRIGNRTGYFPKEYVNTDPHIVNRW